MLYAILAYHAEPEVLALTPQQDAALMADLSMVHERLTRQGKLGPAARLGATGRARTLRGSGAMVIDGPFAETKEQLLGFYIVDVDSEAAAIAAARELKTANPAAVYEIRPIALYLPGTAIVATEAPHDVIRPD
ncbi:MAG TPA: YciI family protein [Steroidobacteraceae bacterium]|jgi:hypothetical protein|nr:YciI family protein [Steroidobacteraceae bacterium]